MTEAPKRPRGRPPGIGSYKRKRPPQKEVKGVSKHHDGIFRINRWSMEGACMDANDLSSLSKEPAVYRVIELRMTGEHLRRRMAMVATRTRMLLADVKTGILFELDGKCLSSEEIVLLCP